MSVAVEHAGIDYHVVLAQNALQQCLEVAELQDELVSALCKQSAPHHSKHGVQVPRRHPRAVSAFAYWLAFHDPPPPST